MLSQGVIMRDGFELSYRIEGSGVPVLVIGSSIYYPRLFAGAASDGLQFIHLDHRGFIKPPAHMKPEDYTLDKITGDIEALRSLLSLQDFVILGHSGHAFMAAEYARLYPQHIRSAVLLCTAPSNSKERQQLSMQCFEEEASPERKQQFQEDMAQLAADLEREPDRRFAHMCIRMAALSFYDYAYRGDQLWNDVYTNMPAIDHLWGEAFASMDLTRIIADLKVPVLIGLGRYDYLVGPSSLWDGIDVRNPHVRLVHFEHSGHTPMLEEPQAFRSILAEWALQ
ncbi:alpha/beta hydrolase [Paenibacillus sambharensis]|uniref:Alpha/beta hydrolase n=1 Tax=Paenibacillus sambharensis TaxID=1803190 RepID=A0A2W1LQ57_9BACL|nr:alpha/beta fold hydrolase [Paenibacillus sambharensis]PZD96985.1 alpha/beta hydrolase [Paenibacillus sambharensis]